MQKISTSYDEILCTLQFYHQVHNQRTPQILSRSTTQYPTQSQVVESNLQTAVVLSC